MNKRIQHELVVNSKNRYGLRKLTIGMVSAVIGTTIYFMSPSALVAKADVIPDDPDTTTEVETQPQPVVQTTSANVNTKKKVRYYQSTKSQTTKTPSQNLTRSANVEANNDNTNSTTTNDIVPDDNTNSSSANTYSYANYSNNNTASNDTNSNLTDANYNNDQVDSNTNITDDGQAAATKSKKSSKLTGKNSGLQPRESLTDSNGFNYVYNSSNGTLTITCSYDKTKVLAQRLFNPYYYETVNIYALNAKHLEIYAPHRGGIKLIDSVSNYNNDLFSNMPKLEDIKGLEYLDTSDLTNFDKMFDGDTNLKSLDLSSFDTSNAKSMFAMFRGCNSLTDIDMSSFKTGNVTDMESMFDDCKSLKAIDTNKIDTINATTMQRMFADCSSLTNLNLDPFGTTKVKNMSGMFDGCTKLASIKLDKINTANVTDMGNMFNNCAALKAIDVHNFNTSNVESMNNMFSGNTSLTNLDLSAFDTKKVTTMYQMFNNDTSLINLNLKNFNTANVNTYVEMFHNCKALPKLDIGSFSFKQADRYDPNQGEHHTYSAPKTDEMLQGLDNLAVLILGDINLTDTTADLNTAGNWFEVGTGTIDKPAGKDAMTSHQVMEKHTPATDTNNKLKSRTYVNPTKLNDKVNTQDLTETVPVDFVISYVDADDQNRKLATDTATQKVNLIHKYTRSLATGDIIGKDEWSLAPNQDIPAAKVPVVNGYLADQAEVNKDTVMNDLKNRIITNSDYHFKVLYHKIGKIIPVDKNNKVITADKNGKDLTSAKQFQLANDPNDATKLVANQKVPDISGYTPKVTTISPTNANDYQVTYLENNNTIYHFKDQDENKELTQLSETTAIGKSINKSSQVAETIAQYEKQGYELVSDPLASPVTASDGQQDLNYIFKHKTHTSDKTITRKRVIHLVDQNNNKVGTDITQTVNFTQTDTIDEVTNKTTNSKFDKTEATFDEVAAPVVKGYDAKTAKIASAKIKPTDQDLEETITYAPTKRTVIINYYDEDDNNKVLDSDTITQEIDSTVDYDPSDKIKALEAKGYVHDKDKDTLPSTIKITDSEQGQTYGVYFKHKQVDTTDDGKNPIAGGDEIKDLKVTKTETIRFLSSKTGKELQPTVTQTVTFTRTAKVDAVTGKVTYSDWDAATKDFPAYKLPTINGYQPSQDTCPKATIAPDQADPHFDIYYSEDKANKLITHFVDQDTGNSDIADAITSDNHMEQVIQKPASADQVVKDLLAKGYELVSDPFKDAPEAVGGQQDVKYVFKHKITDVTDTITRTVTTHFVDDSGKKMAADQVQTFSFKQTGKKDMVTGKVTYDNLTDQTTKAVTAPFIKGYVADKKQIASQKVDTNKNVEQQITYRKIGHIIAQDKNGKVLNDQVAYEQDESDPTAVKGNQEVPKIDGYTPETETVTPSDPSKDTIVTYKSDKDTHHSHSHFVDDDTNNSNNSGNSSNNNNGKDNSSNNSGKDQNKQSSNQNTNNQQNGNQLPDSPSDNSNGVNGADNVNNNDITDAALANSGNHFKPETISSSQKHRAKNGKNGAQTGRDHAKGNLKQLANSGRYGSGYGTNGKSGYDVSGHSYGSSSANGANGSAGTYANSNQIGANNVTTLGANSANSNNNANALATNRNASQTLPQTGSSRQDEAALILTAFGLLCLAATADPRFKKGRRKNK